MSGSGDGKGDLLNDLEHLIEDFRQSDLRELHARAGELEVYLSQDPAVPGLHAPMVSLGTVAQPVPREARPAPTAPPVPAPAASAHGAVPDGATVVEAPYLGTFYRSPKPGAAAYVELGTAVTAETELCLVEVMKLFTAVRAGAAGKVVAILANDGDLVQAGQPLFAIGQG